MTPSGTFMRICSDTSSPTLLLPLVSSESTKPSVSATHSPVWMRVFTRCLPFRTDLSFPKSLRLTPLSTGVQPLAVRKSSRCFFTKVASSPVASTTSVKEGFTSVVASAKASSSAPKPTRLSLPCALRSTPSTTCSQFSMPSPIKVLSCRAASFIASGVIRISSRRSSLMGWSTSKSILFAKGMFAPVPRGRTSKVPQAVTSVTQSVSSDIRAG
mmetsp:Transcript_96710/g.257032  ORF Transcript_96710/g.257032 Transcript_96710/m.257032 type:complete len:214 (+) Transcript_96710:918-1559(+)